MNKIAEYYDFEEERAAIGTNELKNVRIEDIPHGNFIEIANIGEDGVYHMKFEGEFGLEW